MRTEDLVFSMPSGPGFDPEGSGYDYESARRAGFRAGEDGHWPSRAPLSADEARALGLPADAGVLLKGRGHVTFQKGVDVDRDLGYRLVKKGSRYYTVKD